MPVTKTAKRALRVSKRKGVFNKTIVSHFESAVRAAKKTKTTEKIHDAVSLIDKAVAKKAIHKNKAARLKSALSKLLPKTAKTSKKRKAAKK